MRAAMNPVVRDWRRRGKEALDFRRAGKSMWSIQHLTDLRRLLLSWSLLGRGTGEMRRQDVQRGASLPPGFSRTSTVSRTTGCKPAPT